ncbi:hypothetical protein NQZ79_g4118 [Umbelopsis isabellina]|nr:hypothetical protein NQZ79_g4118 [Umbelopsis isabellina]
MSSSEQPDTPASIDRDIKVMSPPQGAAGSQPVPESFYKLTSAEIKQLYQSQVGKRQALENAPLKTKQMRNAEEKERMKKYPKTTIRVRFPDGLVLQINFQSSEKVSTLYDVIRSTLKNKEREFLLVLPPRTQLLDMNQTLFKAGLAPASNVTFVGAKTGGDNGMTSLHIGKLSTAFCTYDFNVEKHELSDEYLSKVQQMPRPTDHTDTAPVSSGNSQASQNQNASGSIKDNVSKTVPKWLQKGLFKK